MNLSLKEAAARLGQTPRQVRYLIQQRRLPASKIAGRWIIREADLPVDEDRDRKRAARAEDLQAAVEEALRPHVQTTPAYSVRSVRAFERAVRACRAAGRLTQAAAVGAELERCVRALSRGAHSYRRSEKSEAWREARRAAAEAVALLYLRGDPAAEAIAAQVESEVLPALAGLLRRQERKP